MESISNVCCTVCTQICVVREAENVFYHDQGLICQRCAHNSANQTSHFALDYMKRNELKEEIMMAMCHPDQGAYFAVKPTFYLICFNCGDQIGDMVSLNLSSPRPILTTTFNQVCKQGFENSIISRWKNRLQQNQRIVDIHKNLIESYFFTSKVPICVNHMYEAFYYDFVAFEFKCNLCTLSETICVYSNQEHLNSILTICRETLKSIPTPAFNSFMIKAFNNQSFDKDFLFFMKNAVDERTNKTITIKTLCLICCQPFGFGFRQAMKLHSDVLHEICLECFGKYDKNTCFIDNCQIDKKLKPVVANPLNKILKRCTEDAKHIFCIRKNEVPYNFCCIPNICHDCYQKPSEDYNSGIECKKCKGLSARENLVPSTHLIKQIEFLEIFCELHNEPAIYYSKKENLCYCKECKESKNVYTKNSLCTEDPIEFRGLLLKLIEDHLQEFPQLVIPQLIKNFGIFFSLQTIFDLCQYLKKKFISNDNQNSDDELIKRCSEEILRFGKIMPLNMNVTQKWAIMSPYQETLRIRSNGCLDLCGIILGNSDGDEDLKAHIRFGGQVYSQKVEKKNQGKLYNSYYFPQSVFVSNDWVEIGVFFEGTAKYVCHGMPSSRYNPLNFKGVEIFVDSDKFDNGNNIIGGPILGFCFSKVILNEEESRIYQLFQFHQF